MVKKLIYIVDDDPNSIKLMETILKTKGYDVLTNTSSVDAYNDIVDTLSKVLAQKNSSVKCYAAVEQEEIVLQV